MLFIANCITGRRKFESNRCRDISGINLIKLCSLICVHLQNTAYTFFFAFGRIQYIGTGIDCSGINSEKCQFSNERVRHNFKCQRGERFIVGRVSLYLVTVQVSSLNCRDICRRRHKLQNCIQKFLNAFVSVCGTAAYGNRSAFAGSKP